MKKNIYITPEITVVELHTNDGILNSLSASGILGNGGDTSSYSITDSDVKGYNGRAGSVNWDDDWSE